MIAAVVVQGWLWNRVPYQGCTLRKKPGKEVVEGRRSSCGWTRCTFDDVASAGSQAEHVRWQD